VSSRRRIVVIVGTALVSCRPQMRSEMEVEANVSVVVSTE
jgi:hypothetical protein